MGKTVLVPFGDGQRYDLAIDEGGTLVRVQCKTGWRSGTTLRFQVSSLARSGKRTDYRGSADIFGVWSPELDKVYLVPVEDCPTRAAWLRLEPTRNNQRDKIRWARDYEVVAGAYVPEFGRSVGA